MGEECSMCSACDATLTGRPGFVICVDGEPVLLNDYPTTGGPWAPVFNPNGTVAWFNTGA